MPSECASVCVCVGGGGYEIQSFQILLIVILELTYVGKMLWLLFWDGIVTFSKIVRLLLWV